VSAPRKVAAKGDTLSARAGAKLRKVLSAPLFEHYFGTPAKCRVAPKSDDGAVGQWICIDCGELPENNFAMHSHPKSHRIAWLNRTAMRVEVP
jgi:hypothetical protein